MRLIATPRFAPAMKKLHPGEKQALDEALRTIAAKPDIGEIRHQLEARGTQLSHVSVDLDYWLIFTLTADASSLRLC